MVRRMRVSKELSRFEWTAPDSTHSDSFIMTANVTSVIWDRPVPPAASKFLSSAEGASLSADSGAASFSLCSRGAQPLEVIAPNRQAYERLRCVISAILYQASLRDGALRLQRLASAEQPS